MLQTWFPTMIYISIESSRRDDSNGSGPVRIGSAVPTLGTIQHHGGWCHQSSHIGDHPGTCIYQWDTTTQSLGSCHPVTFVSHLNLLTSVILKLQKSRKLSQPEGPYRLRNTWEHFTPISPRHFIRSPAFIHISKESPKRDESNGMHIFLICPGLPML